MSKRNLLIGVLLLAAVILGWSFCGARGEAALLREKAATVNYNNKVINFADLFIDKVLKAEGEVDFETRLQLENTVRGLDDKEIFAQWQTFVESPDDQAAQAAVKDLLALLIHKIII